MGFLKTYIMIKISNYLLTSLTHFSPSLILYFPTISKILKSGNALPSQWFDEKIASTKNG